VTTPRIWACNSCGRRGPWGPGWGWLGGNLYDTLGEEGIIVSCPSEACHTAGQIMFRAFERALTEMMFNKVKAKSGRLNLRHGSVSVLCMLCNHRHTGKQGECLACPCEIGGNL
jgi:hypothetical protein